MHLASKGWSLWGKQNFSYPSLTLKLDSLEFPGLTEYGGLIFSWLFESLPVSLGLKCLAPTPAHLCCPQDSHGSSGVADFQSLMGACCFASRSCPDRGQVMARQHVLRGPCRNSQQTGQRGRFSGQGRVGRKERGLPTPDACYGPGGNARDCGGS